MTRSQATINSTQKGKEKSNKDLIQKYLWNLEKLVSSECREMMTKKLIAKAEEMKGEFHRLDSDRGAWEERVWPLALFHAKACAEHPDFLRPSPHATWRVPAVIFILLNDGTALVSHWWKLNLWKYTFSYSFSPFLKKRKRKKKTCMNMVKLMWRSPWMIWAKSQARGSPWSPCADWL